MTPYQDPEILAQVRNALAPATYRTAREVALRIDVPVYTVQRYLPTMPGVERSAEPLPSTRPGRPAYGWRRRVAK